ncbi:hypothetical protein CPB85DRAFT_1301904 [Mucidula mucida]|nr:hypothetical protein CPB85DRAFT_1301904 [Mucidula mucida]
MFGSQSSSDSESSDQFPDLEPGYFDADSGTFFKPVSSRELEVYKAVTPHPRIVAFLGLADYNECISLQYHPLGDLWTYLLEKSPPLSLRIQWAIEIAEGLAHLHSKSIIWADAHFPFLHDLPPPIFAWPRRYFGRTPTYPDIFGFGVILYALLMNRFPWSVGLLPNLDEQAQASNKHEHKDFDTLDDDGLNKCFGSIVGKCFFTQYKDGAELLDELKKAEAFRQCKN